MRHSKAKTLPRLGPGSYPHIPVGRTDLARAAFNHPQAGPMPVGRTGLSVGRTGKTRHYPVGRTGKTTSKIN